MNRADTETRIVTESSACPMSCPEGADVVVVGKYRFHGDPAEFSVVRCRTCGLMRTDPRPTRDCIKFYYPDAYPPFHGAQRNTPADVAGFRSGPRGFVQRFLRQNSKRIPPLPPGRLLEIGAADGAFLDRMAAQGWSVVGIEPSAAAAERARQRGHNVRTTTIEGAPDPSTPFDMIVGWMVLEHLHDPVSALVRLRSWSHPGTYLVLSVPDAGGLEFKIFRDAWFALELPRHLYHFDRETLTRLLHRTGWRDQHFFWHRNPNNLIRSLGYVCEDHGWHRAASRVFALEEARRGARVRALLGRLLADLRLSGRMTVWATPHDTWVP